jgi:hypothetical protein
MSGAIPPLPSTSSWRGAQLKHSCLTEQHCGYEVSSFLLLQLILVQVRAATARTLGSQVRFSLQSWIYVCPCCSVFCCPM